MAGNAIIGALRVVLGADTASLDKGLKDSQGKLQTWASSMAKVGAAAAAAFAVAGGAVAVSIKGVIDQADELGKAAQKWGVPVDELSRLKHAADLSGISFEGLGTSLSKLSRNMSEVAGGAKNDASQAFAALGIAVTNADGTLKSSSQVMTEIAGKFGDMEDGAGKTALAMALFGKSGAEIIPMLNAGAKGLRDMMMEADKLGIVIDGKTTKAAENFNDNLTRLGKVKDGIILKITEGMLPGLEQMSAAMVRAAADTQGLNVVGAAVGGMFAGLIHEVEKFRLAMQRLPVEWEAFKTLMTTPNFFGDFKKLWGDFNAVLQESDRQLQQLIETQRRLPPITLAAIAATLGLGEAHKKLAAPIIQSTELVKAAAREMQEAMSLAGAIDDEAAAIMSRYVTPAQQLQQEVDNINSAFARGILTQDQYGKVSAAVSQKVRENWASAAATAASGFGDLAQAFAKNNKKMAVAAKAFAIGEATINTLVGYTKALSAFVPPFNFVAAAGVLAAGMAKVAMISSQGFKTGGAITVPGGMGGGDRVPAMVDLEPGEQLDIWRPGENGGRDPRRGAQGGGAVTPITVNVPDRRSREWLRDLVDDLNDMARDGYVLKVGKAAFS